MPRSSSSALSAAGSIWRPSNSAYRRSNAASVVCRCRPATSQYRRSSAHCHQGIGEFRPRHELLLGGRASRQLLRWNDRANAGALCQNALNFEAAAECERALTHPSRPRPVARSRVLFTSA